MTQEISLSELGLRLHAAEADPAFVQMARLRKRINLLQVLGTDNRERWHSAFWAWVFDPRGSHGLGQFGLRRLLALAVDPKSGCVRGRRLRLLWETCSDGEGRALLSAEPIGDGPTLSNLLSYDIGASVTAPGQSTRFSEVSARLVAEQTPTGDRTGEFTRFDGLLAARLTPSASAMATPGTLGLNAIVVVIEMKVGAGYKPEQLRLYSSWLHRSPLPKEIIQRNDGDFRDEYERVLDPGRNIDASEILTVGVFVSRFSSAELPGEPPEALTPPWSALNFDDLVRNVLEPMLAHPALMDDARPLATAYLELVADPQMEMLRMPPTEHSNLVRQFLARHAQTMQTIVNVLRAESTIVPPVTPVPGLVDEIEELTLGEREARRARLQPQVLIDNGLAALGDLLVHNPITPKALGRRPFDESLTAELIAGDWRGFNLIGGPSEIVAALVARQPFSATGLLRAVYELYGVKFAGSGNAAWTFSTGVSKDWTLYDAYAESLTDSFAPA